MPPLTVQGWEFVTPAHDAKCKFPLKPTEILAALHVDQHLGPGWNLMFRSTASGTCLAIVQMDGRWQVRARLRVSADDTLRIHAPDNDTDRSVEWWTEWFVRNWPALRVFDPPLLDIEFPPCPTVLPPPPVPGPTLPSPPSFGALLDVRPSPEDGLVPAVALSDMLIHQRTGLVMRQGSDGTLYLFRAPNSPHPLAKADASLHRLPQYPYFDLRLIEGAPKMDRAWRKAMQLFRSCLALLIFNYTSERL